MLDLDPLYLSGSLVVPVLLAEGAKVSGRRTEGPCSPRPHCLAAWPGQ